MKKTIRFDLFYGSGWPHVSELKAYFLAPSGQEWVFRHGEDCAQIAIEGIENTDHLEQLNGRIDVGLEMWGYPHHGVLIIYFKRGGKYAEFYASLGDVGRLREWIRNRRCELLSVGLFVPFKSAWEAVKEFIETEGVLPKSIEWIEMRDLPPNSFPEL